MAVLRNTLLAALALAYTTSAVPLAVDRRAAETHIVTETVWTTVDVTTTVWVEPTSTSQTPPAAATTTPSAVQPISPAAPPPPPAAAAVASNSPAAFAQQAAQPPPASSPAAPAAPPPAAASPAPAAPSKSSAPSVEAKTAGASSGGPCEGAGNMCSGDVTHYEGGLGACGWNVNTASDMQIALPHGLMGTQSNGNPYCGRSLSIKAADGSIVKATVGDKCMGCEGQSIDLTDALFKAVVPNGDGRVSGIQWYFD